MSPGLRMLQQGSVIWVIGSGAHSACEILVYRKVSTTTLLYLDLRQDAQ